MKISTKRRLLSLLLALVMVLSLAPAALLAEGDGAEEPGTTPPGNTGETDPGDTEPGDTDEKPDPDKPDPPAPGTITELKLNCDAWDKNTEHYSLVLEPNSTANQGVRIEVSWEPDDSTTEDLRVVWKSNDSEVASVTEQDNGHTAYIYGKVPGETKITASAGGITHEISVVVSGIKLITTALSIKENEIKTFAHEVDYKLYGKAAPSAGDATAIKLHTSVLDKKPNIYVPTPKDLTATIEGRQAGNATLVLEISTGGSVYKAEVPVSVESNEFIISWTGGVDSSNPLKFSELENLISDMCQDAVGGRLLSVIGLTVPTEEGTLYLGYNSPNDTGAGVGGAITYYASNATRGPYIKDLTFVPNPSFSGETAIISFTGNAIVKNSEGVEENRTFKGKIEVTLEEVDTDLTLRTPQGKPLGLTGSLFSEACQRETGSPLSYVTFTLPPESEASLYTGYVSDANYGTRVSATDRFSRTALDGVTFVPAESYVGTVVIDYLGYSVSNARFKGQLTVRVTQDLDSGLVYNDDGAGRIDFNGADFNDFCLSVTGERLVSVRFTLPSANQGTLYENYRSDRKSNTEVREWRDYYYYRSSSSNTVRDDIDRITFVAASGFHGTVRVPFTGEDRYGGTFKGTVELHFQSEEAGQINYDCAPGGDVRLAAGDFAQLCQELTGQRLHYVSFQALPEAASGVLYHERTSAGAMGTKAAKDTKYYNSALPYLSDLSFWASESFRGSVEVPFTACAVTGETFTGLMVIRAEGGGPSGGGLSYTTTGRELVTFSGDDFNTFCRTQSTGALNYVQFSTPSSAQGILYFRYNASDDSTAQVTEEDKYYLNGAVSVGKVSFLPAYGFSGTAYIPFTAVSTGGKELRGTVEIVVRPDLSSSGSVRYATRGVPVTFNAGDFSANGVQPVSVRFTSLPSPQEGRLFYQYSGPTRYSWEANTTAVYRPGGDPSLSSLTFVPRAGFQGNVSIPYMASFGDGTQFQGQVLVSIVPAAASLHFNDLEGCASETITAIDYLFDRKVVNGTGNGRYAPGESIRRGDFSLMLWRAFQFEGGNAEKSFADVADGDYYAVAVNTLSSLGIVNGTGSNRFQPNSTISRQDAAVMVQRTLQAAGMTADDGALSELNAFTDGGEVSGYARTALACLIQQRLLRTGDGLLNPKADLTRADMAVLLHRAITR